MPGTQCSGNLADPSNPEGSLLYTKLLLQPTCGARMPFGGTPLSEAEIVCVRDWISGLIPPTPPMVDGGPTCPDCACTIGAMRECYTGPSNTVGVGVCQAGAQTCRPTPTGSVWGPCEGEVIPSPEQCANEAVDEDCDGVSPSCDGHDLWSFALIGVATGQNARSVAVDSQDNVYVAGDFGEWINLGGGELYSDGDKDDVFLAKLDRHGNHLWSKKFGDTSTQNATKVIVDANDNVILLGRAFGRINFGGTDLRSKGTDDIFVAKFRPDGSHVWSKMFGGRDPDRAERMTTDSSGNVWITGTFTGEVDFGFGPVTSAGIRDAFVLKLSGSTGDPLKAIPLGGGIVDPEDPYDTGDDYGFGIDVDADDNVYVTGYFSNTMRFEGGSLLTSAGGTDVFLAKLDRNGVHIWSKSFGGREDDKVFDLVVDKRNGDVVITGYFADAIDFGGANIASRGSWDIFVAKLDKDGDHVFSAGYGDGANQLDFGTFDRNTWSSLDMDAQGNILLAGTLVGGATFGVTPVTSAGGMDAFLVKLAPNGTAIYGKPFGTSGTEMGLDVAATKSGHALLVGRFYTSAINFGSSGTIRGIGGSMSGGDGFVARLLVD